MCNHPYMFDGAEPEPFHEGDHLWQSRCVCLSFCVRAAPVGGLWRRVVLQLFTRARARLIDSGKLWVLEKLLPRLRAEGHRVLMFCTSTSMLDIVQDYLTCVRACARALAVGSSGLGCGARRLTCDRAGTGGSHTSAWMVRTEAVTCAWRPRACRGWVAT